MAGARMLVRLKDSARVATCEPWPNPLIGILLKAHIIKTGPHLAVLNSLLAVLMRRFSPRRNLSLLANLDRNWRRALARNFRRIFQLLQDIGDSCIQLHIIAAVHGQRIQGHVDIRSNAFILNTPFALRREYTE